MPVIVKPPPYDRSKSTVKNAGVVGKASNHVHLTDGKWTSNRKPREDIPDPAGAVVAPNVPASVPPAFPGAEVVTYVDFQAFSQGQAAAYLQSEAWAEYADGMSEEARENAERAMLHRDRSVWEEVRSAIKRAVESPLKILVTTKPRLYRMTRSR